MSSLFYNLGLILNPELEKNKFEKLINISEDTAKKIFTIIILNLKCNSVFYYKNSIN